MILPTNQIVCGDVLDVLRTFPDESVQCCVTSPPYWGLRDYGAPGQIGLEPTLGEWVSKMVEVFREVKRALRPDGTLWLNLGDGFAGSGKGRNSDGAHSCKVTDKQASNVGSTNGRILRPAKVHALKSKDLFGMPWRVAFALQDDGWYLRSDIIWHKLNPMPESVTDRPTRVHEYVFLMTKAGKYYYDADAIRESYAEAAYIRSKYGWEDTGPRLQGYQPNHADNRQPTEYSSLNLFGRNKRSVWTISSEPFPGGHFAVFPQKLVEPCIMAGTSEKGCCPSCGAPWRRVTERRRSKASNAALAGTKIVGKGHPADQVRGNHDIRDGPVVHVSTIGWEPSCKCGSGEIAPCVVLDPFMGSGTTALVAIKARRNFVGIELNPEYVKLANERIATELNQPRLF